MINGLSNNIQMGNCEACESIDRKSNVELMFIN